MSMTAIALVILFALGYALSFLVGIVFVDWRDQRRRANALHDLAMRRLRAEEQRRLRAQHVDRERDGWRQTFRGSGA